MPLVRPLLLLGLVLCGIAASSVSAEEKPAIRWMLTGVPPKFIPDGPFRGTGYGEQQAAYLAQRLPQFQQSVELVTPARLWHEIQTRKGICSIGIAKLPEREPWALFTQHYVSAPPYRMLVRQDRLAEFAPFRLADGRLNLDQLAASQKLTGIYVTGRHYTAQINSFIDSPNRKAPLEPTRASTTIFEMIASRRGDFSFASVAEMNYFNAVQAATPQQGKPRPPLAMLPIDGGNEAVHAHIACSRDALGREMIETLDRLFEDESAWNAFLMLQKHWLADVPQADR